MSAPVPVPIKRPRLIWLFVVLSLAIMLGMIGGKYLGWNPLFCMWIFVPSAITMAVLAAVTIPWRKPTDPQALHPIVFIGGIIRMVGGAFRYIVSRDDISMPLELIGALTLFSGLALSAWTTSPNNSADTK